jgi:hypothetical protein
MIIHILTILEWPRFGARNHHRAPRETDMMEHFNVRICGLEQGDTLVDIWLELNDAVEVAGRFSDMPRFPQFSY